MHHIDDIIRLAHISWPDTYHGLVEAGQIDYMLAQIYQVDLIEAQMKDPMHHFLVMIDDEQLLGYTQCIELGDKIKLSKLYILPHLKGKGLGKQLMQTV